MKIVVLLVFLLIVISLATALFTFFKDGGDQDSNRTVKALTMRIGLSIGLFIFLMIGYANGWIQPHGIQ